jgi:hypothetical protein
VVGEDHLDICPDHYCQHDIEPAFSQPIRDRQSAASQGRGPQASLDPRPVDNAVADLRDLAEGVALTLACVNLDRVRKRCKDCLTARSFEEPIEENWTGVFRLCPS